MKYLVTFAALGWAAWWATPAQGAPIVTNIVREVFARAQDTAGTGDQMFSSTSFAPQTLTAAFATGFRAVGSAEQTFFMPDFDSLVWSGHVQAIVGEGADAGAADADASSTLEFTLTLNGTYAYLVTPFLESFITPDGAASFDMEVIGPNGPVMLGLAGILDAGVYTFVITAEASVDTDDNPSQQIGSFIYDFTLDLEQISAVPEPASLLLWSVGLASIGWAARRRARANRG